MDAIMTQTFATLSSVITSWCYFMGISGAFLVIIALIPHREEAHKAVDWIYDRGNAFLDWVGNTTHNLIQATKETAVLAALPFIFLAQGFWDLTKITAKGLAISAVVLSIISVTAVVIGGAALSFWIALPFLLTYIAGRKVVSTAKAVKVKVAQMIENHKAAMAEKAEKAEADRLEQVKAEAISLGFVSGDEVEAMIAKAIAKHEAEKHISKAAELTAEDMEVVELVENAITVVQKSIQDFDLDTKTGRADARQYLQDSGVAVARHANRYEIAKKFHLLN